MEHKYMVMKIYYAFIRIWLTEFIIIFGAAIIENIFRDYKGPDQILWRMQSKLKEYKVSLEKSKVHEDAFGSYVHEIIESWLSC